MGVDYTNTYHDVILKYSIKTELPMCNFYFPPMGETRFLVE